MLCFFLFFALNYPFFALNDLISASYFLKTALLLDLLSGLKSFSLLTVLCFLSRFIYVSAKTEFITFLQQSRIG